MPSVESKKNLTRIVTMNIETFHNIKLNLDQSAIEFICKRFPDDEEIKKCKNKPFHEMGYIRRRLGKFDLVGREHTQKMKFRSSDEKSRIALCISSWNN